MQKLRTRPGEPLCLISQPRRPHGARYLAYTGKSMQGALFGCLGEKVFCEAFTVRVAVRSWSGSRDQLLRSEAGGSAVAHGGAEGRNKKKKVRGLGGVACEVDQVHYSHQVRLE